MHPLKVTWRDFGSFDTETPVFFIMTEMDIWRTDGYIIYNFLGVSDV